MPKKPLTAEGAAFDAQPMGQGASQEEADATGYRVLGVQPGSPASAVGLVSFFDFVVACDGARELRELDSTFIDKIKGSEDDAPCPVPSTI